MFEPCEDPKEERMRLLEAVKPQPISMIQVPFSRAWIALQYCMLK